MSLVAYGSSDESGNSDSEEEETTKTELEVTVPKKDDPSETTHVIPEDSKSAAMEPHISDDEDYIPVNLPHVERGLSLPAPKYSGTGNTTSICNNSPLHTVVDLNQSDEKSSLLGLPTPLVKSSAVSETVEEDELEEMVKPKDAEMAIREKPPPKRKIIKIAAPSIEDYESDEEEPSKKKQKPVNPGSGLFALLPKPKHVSVKEAGRALIPHTLTKKPASSVKPAATKPARPSTAVPKPSVKPVSAVLDYDSGEDGEDKGDNESSSNFFSIGSDDAASKERLLLSATSYSVTSSLSTLPPVPKNTPKSTETVAPVSSVSESEEQTSPVSQMVPLLQDAPLQFKTNAPSSSSSYGYPVNPASYYGAPDSYSDEQPTSNNYNLAEYDEQQSEDMGYTAIEPEPELMPKDELLRLQGKKQWGKETINFIDVSADDQTNKMDLTKNLTEEVDMVTHSKKNTDLPSGQQRRKHQITYLAHKAKEREFDLKNQWAQNRATKKQSQNKYGF